MGGSRRVWVLLVISLVTLGLWVEALGQRIVVLLVGVDVGRVVLLVGRLLRIWNFQKTAGSLLW